MSPSAPLQRPVSGGDGCMFFISLYDYDPATMSPNPGAVEDELPFREGDIIKVSPNFPTHHKFYPYPWLKPYKVKVWAYWYLFPIVH